MTQGFLTPDDKNPYGDYMSPQGNLTTAMAQQLGLQAAKPEPVYGWGQALAKVLAGGLAGYQLGHNADEASANMKSAPGELANALATSSGKEWTNPDTGQQVIGPDQTQNLMRLGSNSSNPFIQQKTADIGLKQIQDAPELALKREVLDQGKFTPIKDVFGNITGMFNSKTGEMQQIDGMGDASNQSMMPIDTTPSDDPQKAAQQILDETGIPSAQVASRQDITGRNAQAKAYRDAANGAKSTIQQLDQLQSQTGKYTSGSMKGKVYGFRNALGMNDSGAAARTEADKASKALANSFMQQNVGAKGAGIRMVEFDSGAVPNADMNDEARTALIEKNRAIANSQVQRAAISDMYPRMHLSNVNAIMDAYEQKNPPILPDGSANRSWMTYKDWLKEGRPNTAAMAVGAKKSSTNSSAIPPAAIDALKNDPDRIGAMKDFEEHFKLPPGGAQQYFQDSPQSNNALPIDGPNPVVDMQGQGGPYIPLNTPQSSPQGQSQLTSPKVQEATSPINIQSFRQKLLATGQSPQAVDAYLHSKGLI